MISLDRTQEMINAINQSNSNNDKIKALENFPDQKELLHWIYSPYKQFNVTSANLKKRKDLSSVDSSDDIISVLKLLSDREVTGHAAIGLVNGFISKNPQHEELIHKIIDKNLETRMDTKSINKVFPNLIPEFSVALANAFDDKIASKINLQDYYASRKLDGVRVIVIKKGDDVKFFSRSGKEFFTLDKVKEQIIEIWKDEDIVLDGEICLVDENGNEDFQSVMKEIRRKNHTVQNPVYNVFDRLFTQEFENKYSSRKLKERLAFLISSFSEPNQYIRLIKQTPIESADHLAELTTEAEANGWEGLILRKNAPYRGKRSNDLLKVKKFYDEEYIVNSVENGPIRYINDQGKEVKEEMLSHIYIEHRGNLVGVGSGFSMEQRREFYRNPSKIIGKTITVKFFEETKDQTGKYSLRFPTVKTIHGDERDT